MSTVKVLRLDGYKNWKPVEVQTTQMDQFDKQHCCKWIQTTEQWPEEDADAIVTLASDTLVHEGAVSVMYEEYGYIFVNMS